MKISLSRILFLTVVLAAIPSHKPSLMKGGFYGLASATYAVAVRADRPRTPRHTEYPPVARLERIPKIKLEL